MYEARQNKEKVSRRIEVPLINKNRIIKSAQSEMFIPNKNIFQGKFFITVDKASCDKSNLSLEALENINKLRDDLFRTYSRIYNSVWHIVLSVDSSLDPNPAYTNFVSNDKIQITFRRWFLEKCSYGELAGMANHELNVHEFANIAILTAGKLNNSLMINNSQYVIKNLGQGGLGQYGNDIFDRATGINGYITAGLGKNNFTPGVSNYNLFDVNDLISFEMNNNAPGFMQDTATKSPNDIVSHGGQRDHAYMSYLYFNQDQFAFSPRALVYAQMTIKQIDDKVKYFNQQPNQQQNSFKKEIVDMLGFFFLDIARTWHESLKNTYIDNVMARNLLFTINGDIVKSYARNLYEWMFDPNTGNVNPKLGVPFDNASATIMKEIKDDVIAKISHQKKEMLNLFYKAAQSEIIELIYRQPRDYIKSMFGR